MIQQSVKNRSIADLARLVLPSDSTSTRNAKHVWRSFIPDAVAIETDSRLSNHALIVVLGVSPGYEIVNKFLLFFSYFYRLRLSALYSSVHSNYFFCTYIQFQFLYTFIYFYAFLVQNFCSSHLLSLNSLYLQQNSAYMLPYQLSLYV